MSSEQIPTPPPPPPPPPRRHPALTVLMVLVGLILMLPGLCAIVFIGALGQADGGLIALWLGCVAVAVGGIALIVRAVR